MLKTKIMTFLATQTIKNSCFVIGFSLLLVKSGVGMLGRQKNYKAKDHTAVIRAWGPS